MISVLELLLIREGEAQTTLQIDTALIRGGVLGLRTIENEIMLHCGQDEKVREETTVIYKGERTI